MVRGGATCGSFHGMQPWFSKRIHGQNHAIAAHEHLASASTERDSIDFDVEELHQPLYQAVAVKSFLGEPERP